MHNVSHVERQEVYPPPVLSGTEKNLRRSFTMNQFEEGNCMRLKYFLL